PSPLLCVFVSSLTRRPPISTLFPYTTLFRSRARPPRSSGRSRQRGPLPRLRRSQLHHRPEPRRRRRLDYRPCAHPGIAGYTVGLDRKSTRLNSSHVKISYAVFCLKKKKQNNT